MPTTCHVSILICFSFHLYFIFISSLQAYLAAARGETEHVIRDANGCSGTMLIDPELRAAYGLRFDVRVLKTYSGDVCFEGSTSMQL